MLSVQNARGTGKRLRATGCGEIKTDPRRAGKLHRMTAWCISCPATARCSFPSKPTVNSQRCPEHAIPAYVLATALFARFRLATGRTFGEKLLSAMSVGFGGYVAPGPKE